MKDKRPQSQFERQKSELEQLIELHRMRYIDLYYCDESHFGLTPNVGYAWQHKDNPVLLPAAKGKRLSVLGLMTPDCKLFSRTFEGAINSDGAIAAMDEFCQKITKRTVVVIDNAPIHRSKKFMAKIKKWKEQGLWVYYLPPYSPELNRIEILWQFIKYRWLPFDAFLNFQKLKERLNDTLNKIGTKCIINFY
ncbi:MAG: IS630 family transposase [Phocaeicola sp.]